MSNKSLDQLIQAKIGEFANQLSELVKATALESVNAALGGGAAPVRRGPRPAAAKASKRAGGKRTPEQVAKLAETTLAYMKAHPGQRLEEIARGLKVSTKELKFPIGKLVEGKQLVRKGQKRGMKYFAK